MQKPYYRNETRKKGKWSLEGVMFDRLVVPNGEVIVGARGPVVEGWGVDWDDDDACKAEFDRRKLLVIVQAAQAPLNHLAQGRYWLT